MRSERRAVVVLELFGILNFFVVAVYSFVNKIYCIIVNCDLIRPRHAYTRPALTLMMKELVFPSLE